MYQNLSYCEKSRLPLTLTPVFIGQLLVLDSLKYSAFGMATNGNLQEVLYPEEMITSQFVSEYAQNFGTEIFIHDYDNLALTQATKEEINKLSRSLSIGNALKNATKHLNYLSMQMDALYRDPLNDSLLNSQYQNSKNLSAMLLNHTPIHKDLFHNLSRSNYHYTIKQPLLSSLLLLSFTQHLGSFSDQEIQNMFLTSYFKDIGMGFIPREKFELAHLSEFDKKLFSEHAESSMKILDQRLPFSSSQLNTIKNHHYLNFKIQSLITGSSQSLHEEEMLTGVESALLSGIDIYVAMTQDRPYRKAMSSYQALELLKKVLIDEYPQEFKALVIFLKKFIS